MKVLLTILSIVFLGNFVSAQSNVWWFDAGIKAGYGAGGLYNKNITDSKEYNNGIGSAYSYGAKVSVNFDNHGFTIDGMLGHGNHIYKHNDDQAELNWSTIDIYALYRNNRNITYFEIGPKLSFLSSANQTDFVNSSSLDVKDYYRANELSGVFGFGWYAMGGGSFSGILGLRLEYGITDFVSDKGVALGAPISEVNLDPYAKSNRLSASVVFELNWGIGYFGKAKCGARSKFISFD